MYWEFKVGYIPLQRFPTLHFECGLVFALHYESEFDCLNMGICDVTYIQSDLKFGEYNFSFANND